MKKTIYVLSFILAISLISFNSAYAQTKESKIKILNESDFKENISTGLVFVDFYADWCGPCRMMQPVLEEFAQEYKEKMVVAKVNTDKNKKLAQTYRISGIPCMILFKDGKEIKRVVGYQNKENLVNALSSYLK